MRPLTPAVAESRYRWLVLAAGTAAQTSFSAVLIGLPVLAPALRDAYDLSLFQVGLVLDSVWIGPIVTLLPWGLLADRVGERLVLTVGLGGCGAALIGAAHAGDFTQLILLLVLAGAAGASVNSASGRAVMQWFPASQRGLALGVRQTAIPLGGLISALSLPALGLHAAFILLAALCFAGAIFWWLCGGSSLYLVAQVAVTGFIVLFLHDERGFSPGEAAAVLAGIQVLATVLRIATGRWSDLIGSRLVPLRIVGAGSSLTLAVVAAVLDAPIGVLVPAFILAGGFAMSWNGLSFTAAAELAGRGRSGAAIGMQQTSLSVAGALVPPAFAAVVAATSWRVGFALAAVFPLVGVQLLRPLRSVRA